MRKINYFVIDDENGIFQGFITAMDKQHAKQKLKEINPKFKIYGLLAERGKKSNFRNNM